MTSSRYRKWLFIAILVLGRCIPHPWNMTPTITIALFSGRQWSRSASVVVTMLGLLLSDVFLAIWQHHAIFGVWSVFTYSALAIIVCIAYACRECRLQHAGLLLLASSLFFWLWSNLGSWYVMPVYSKNLSGLWQCYVAALPFLRQQLLGDVVWFTLTMWSWRVVCQRFCREYV